MSDTCHFYIRKLLSVSLLHSVDIHRYLRNFLQALVYILLIQTNCLFFFFRLGALKLIQSSSWFWLGWGMGKHRVSNNLLDLLRLHGFDFFLFFVFVPTFIFKFLV